MDRRGRGGRSGREVAGAGSGQWQRAGRGPARKAGAWPAGGLSALRARSGTSAAASPPRSPHQRPVLRTSPVPAAIAAASRRGLAGPAPSTARSRRVGEGRRRRGWGMVLLGPASMGEGPSAQLRSDPEGRVLTCALNTREGPGMGLGWK